MQATKKTMNEIRKKLIREIEELTEENCKICSVKKLKESRS